MLSSDSTSALIRATLCKCHKGSTSSSLNFNSVPDVRDHGFPTLSIWSCFDQLYLTDYNPIRLSLWLLVNVSLDLPTLCFSCNFPVTIKFLISLFLKTWPKMPSVAFLSSSLTFSMCPSTSALHRQLYGLYILRIRLQYTNLYFSILYFLWCFFWYGSAFASVC